MKDRFHKSLIVVLICLVILVTFFALLNANLKPSVKKIEVMGSQFQAEISNQKIKVTFSHPMQKNNVLEHLTFEPRTSFDLFWKENELSIVFNENLKSNTKYQIRLSKELQDTYNQKLASDVIYSFKTKQLALFYIEQDLLNKTERLVHTNAEFGDKTILYENQNIQHYAVNKKYIVISTRNADGSNTLHLIHRESKKIKEISFTNHAISNLTIQPEGTTAMFIGSAMEQTEAGLLPSSNTYIYAYNISNDKIERINPQNTANYATNLIYSSDGSALLYQGDNATYYLLDSKNYDNLVIIGRHDMSGGFNGKNNKIVFNNIINFSPNISIYNSNKQESVLTGDEIFPIDPVFAHSSDTIFFSSKIAQEDLALNQFEIKAISVDKKISDIVSIKDKSLELPLISQDDRYLVIEQYDTDASVDPSDIRIVGLQLKPGTAQLIIYDIETQKIIDKGITGINALWLE